jgi:hypothetical protein
MSKTILLKEGLMANEYDVVVGNVVHTMLDIYASDGYRFYNKTQPENYDDGGNTLPLDQLVYLTAHTVLKARLNLDKFEVVREEALVAHDSTV